MMSQPFGSSVLEADSMDIDIDIDMDADVDPIPEPELEVLLNELFAITSTFFSRFSHRKEKSTSRHHSIHQSPIL